MFVARSLSPVAGVFPARVLLYLSLGALSSQGQSRDPSQFFESKVRPIFVARCASCHGDQVQMGGKQFTSKDGLHRAGVVVAGDPDGSSLVQAIRYNGKVKMPPTGKLPDGGIFTLPL
jgi:hypothetical protein